MPLRSNPADSLVPFAKEKLRRAGGKRSRWPVPSTLAGNLPKGHHLSLLNRRSNPNPTSSLLPEMVVAGSAVDEAGTGHKWRERDRLAALRSYHVLDTAPEPAFDSLVQLAAQVCDTPIAAINLIEDRRQWFKAEVGLGFRETPVEVSICAKAILQRGLFIVRDITQDSRFASTPLVTGPPHVQFYAGALLETPQGLPLGTLCALDYEPRDLDEQQRAG